MKLTITIDNIEAGDAEELIVFAKTLQDNSWSFLNTMTKLEEQTGGVNNPDFTGPIVKRRHEKGQDSKKAIDNWNRVNNVGKRKRKKFKL